jgi:hypothetical protein
VKRDEAQDGGELGLALDRCRDRLGRKTD